MRVAAMLILASLAGPQDDLFSTSYKGKAPPELKATGEWLNTKETPTLAKLKGKVVWIEFGFLG